MTDEELVDAMLDKAHFHGELNDAREPVWLRAAILKALKDARQRVAKLESDAAKLSGIMWEYSHGYHDVCQQLKAASVETVSALHDTAHEVPGFHVLDLSGQGVNHD